LGVGKLHVLQNIKCKTVGDALRYEFFFKNHEWGRDIGYSWRCSPQIWTTEL
jgi:hypothetical protein